MIKPENFKSPHIEFGGINENGLEGYRSVPPDENDLDARLLEVTTQIGRLDDLLCFRASQFQWPRVHVRDEYVFNDRPYEESLWAELSRLIGIREALLDLGARHTDEPI
jgi:hypothetical protein